MMIKSMLMSLLTVMLLGIILSSKSVHVALNKSIHWLPIILKWTPSLSLEEKGPGPRAQVWLAPDVTRVSPSLGSRPELPPPHALPPESEGKHLLWGLQVYCTHTPVRHSWSRIVIAYWPVSFDKPRPPIQAQAIFFISVVQSYIIVPSRYRWNILHKCGINAYCVWNIPSTHISQK